MALCSERDLEIGRRLPDEFVQRRSTGGDARPVIENLVDLCWWYYDRRVDLVALLEPILEGLVDPDQITGKHRRQCEEAVKQWMLSQ